MGTIKLRRGTGSPAGSLAQYEVAMDVAAQKLYVSSNGTDAVILANKYDDADADARVNLQTGANLDLSSKSTSDLSEGTNEYFTDARAITAIEDASSLTLSGGLTTESGLTNTSGNYGQNLKANRENGETNPGGLATILVQRDLGTETLGGGFDSRGPAIDFNMTSDDGGLTQYQGGIQFQSNNDDNVNPEAYLRAYSWDGGTQDTILQANKDLFYTYGQVQALASATLYNRVPWSGDGDNEAPLVVKANYENADVVAAEFWNMTNNDENKVKIHLGTDDAGAKTYQNEIRSGKAGDEKSLQFNALADNGDVEDTLYQMTRDDSDGSLKHDFFGRVDVNVDGSTTSQMMDLEGDMLNRSQIFMNGLTTKLNFKTDPIPNNAEMFQSFSVTNDADGTKPVGNFGAKYSSANNGELSEMRLIAQDHNFNEKEIGVNQRNSYTNAPFQFANLNQTEINALTNTGAGTVVWNNTDTKLQVYTGTAWVDLH